MVSSRERLSQCFAVGAIIQNNGLVIRKNKCTYFMRKKRSSHRKRKRILILIEVSKATMLVSPNIIFFLLVVLFKMGF